MNRSPQRDKSATSRWAPYRSFTLVELLVALALAAMLVVAIGQVAVSTVQTQRVTDLRIERRERAARIWDTLSADLSRMTAPLPGEETNVRVFDTPSPTLEFSGLASIDTSHDMLHVSLTPATLRYRLVIEQNRRLLVREVVDATSSGRPTRRERMASAVAEFGVEGLVNGQWLKSFPTAKEPKAAMEMFRVTIRLGENQDQMQRTFVLDRKSPRRSPSPRKTLEATR